MGYYFPEDSLKEKRGLRYLFRNAVYGGGDIKSIRGSVFISRKIGDEYNNISYIVSVPHASRRADGQFEVFILRHKVISGENKLSLPGTGDTYKNDPTIVCSPDEVVYALKKMENFLKPTHAEWSAYPLKQDFQEWRKMHWSLARKLLEGASLTEDQIMATIWDQSNVATAKVYYNPGARPV